MTRVNAPPTTDARQKWLHPKPVKTPEPLASSDCHVSEVVAQKFILKIDPFFEGASFHGRTYIEQLHTTIADRTAL